VLCPGGDRETHDGDDSSVFLWYDYPQAPAVIVNVLLRAVRDLRVRALTIMRLADRENARTAAGQCSIAGAPPLRLARWDPETARDEWEAQIQPDIRLRNLA
jgi:hypothetical protein